MDGGSPIDRRAERCSATACVAHVRRRSLCSRQQLLVSRECQVLIPQVPGGVHLSYPCHTDRQRRSGSALGARTPEVSNRVRPGRATSQRRVGLGVLERATQSMCTHSQATTVSVSCTPRSNNSCRQSRRFRRSRVAETCALWLTQLENGGHSH